MNRPARIELDIVYHPATADTNEDGQAAPAKLSPTVPPPIAVADDTARFHLAAAFIAERYQLALFTVSISLVDDSTIREVNREELEHDWATDVISFVFEETTAADGLHVDGEVIASYETAQRLAAAAGWSVEDELLLYVVHGMLHLAGLDDIDDEDRQRMREAEQACLIALGVPGAAGHVEQWERIE